MATEQIKVPRHWPFPRVSKRGIVLSTFAVLALLVGGFAWLLFQPSQAKGGVEGVGIGQPAPGFTLPDTTGKPISLSGLRGHPVIINFWASYCLPCRGETPLLVQLYANQQARGLVVLGIDEGEALPTILQYRQDFRITYPLLQDPTLQFNSPASYNPVLLPRTYFIDAAGVVRKVVDGALSPQTLQEGYQAISQ